MEIKLYTIESRYERWTKDSVVWTDWFNTMTVYPTSDIKALEDQIKTFKKRDKESKMKLKHEYRIVDLVKPVKVEKKKKAARTKKSKKQ